MLRHNSTQWCDFHEDCADGTDERECPGVYLFDDCQQEVGSADCDWLESTEDKLNWVIASAANVTGSVGGNEGKFLWIQKKGAGWKTSTAYTLSPTYQNTKAGCTLRFRYFISGNLDGWYVKPVVHQVGTNPSKDIQLDFLSLTDEWKVKEISLGRRREGFQVGFMKGAHDVFDATVAVDEVGLNFVPNFTSGRFSAQVMFMNCDLPRPQSECSDATPSRCNNGVCILNEQRCDLQDDCGDNSDEDSLYCDENPYLQVQKIPETKTLVLVVAGEL